MDRESPQDGAPPVPSGDVEAILQKALTYADEEEWEQVVEILRDSLEAHPDDPYLLCWLGLAERELGMEGIAYERFRRTLEADPRDPVLLATAGNALAASDDPAAEAALRTAALLAPDLPQARWMYGAYLSREGMVEDALVELDAALELDPEDPVIHLEQGTARALGGDLEGASYSFARASELDPEDGWTLILLGLARLQEDELEEAVPVLEEGARLRPDDLEAQLLASLSLSAWGWEDRALEMLERARLHSEGVDAAMVLEAELRLDEGPEASLRFLTETLVPPAFRERLLQRP